MADIVLMGLPPSSYVRTAMMVCASKGVSYDLEPVNFRSDAYRDMHPFGRMPVLQHGDFRVFETLAIAFYIDAAFDGAALQPATAQERAEMLQWISAINDYFYASIVSGCVSERFIKPMRGLAPDEARITAAAPEIERCIKLLEQKLKPGAFLCGYDLTLADLFLAPILVYFAATPEGATLLPKFERVRKWLDKISTTPDFAKINALGS